MGDGPFLPVKAGFARWILQFRSSWYIPTTEAGRHWATRDNGQPAIAFVPDRMIDAVSDMLGAWRKNSNRPGGATSAFLPVMFLALAKDTQPAPAEEGGVNVARPQFVRLDDGRWVKLRTTRAMRRAQVVIVAAESETAADIAAQFLAWVADVQGQSFRYEAAAGAGLSWPCSVRSGDAYASADAQEQFSTTVLHIDLDLVATLPHIDDNSGAGYPSAGLSVVEQLGAPMAISEDTPAAVMLSLDGADYQTLLDGLLMLGDFPIALETDLLGLQ
ncbi:hypothetical protein [Ideonella livida]|uniref:Uncharacterized protein n=1 Tax=Ideonella livida TaxID=2707176 RepID=A0A7C9TIT4_9BURK|nr:hypothetical protein [Ideonella livida]NDY89727.1 hypothetical protein [Ideonella livida]